MNKVLNDTELEEISGGIFIVFASSHSPAFDPVSLKPEYEKVKSGKNELIPIP